MKTSFCTHPKTKRTNKHTKQTKGKYRQHQKIVLVEIPLVKEPGVCFQKRMSCGKDLNKVYKMVEPGCRGVQDKFQ